MTSKQESEVATELANSMFIRRALKQIEEGKGPDALQEHSDLVGQVMHDVAPGCNVYVMLCNERGSKIIYAKIGISGNVTKRLSAIRTDCPLEVHKVVYFCCGGSVIAAQCESLLHEHFRDRWCSNEWFQFNDDEEFLDGMERLFTKMREFLGNDYNRFEYDPSISHLNPGVIALRKYLKKAAQITVQKMKFDFTNPDCYNF